MAAYSVKEMYYTLQGEGFHCGRAAVFLRFAGCNLWTGREKDRHKAICQFCDTDFVGTNGPNGGKFESAQSLAEKVISLWPATIPGKPFVVCTGGEPMLQLDEDIIDSLHLVGLEIAVETNGTIPAVAGIDWICMSPKANSEIVQRSGQELKIVYPQLDFDPAAFADWDFEHFYLQPMDSPTRADNTKAAIAYCLEHPQWRLSVQMHKTVGIL